LNSRQSPQEYFRLILLTVVGQAFSAAGYALEERPVQWDGGQFRFVKPLEGRLNIIEFQMLAYADTLYTVRQPSRFRVTLVRGASSGSQPDYTRRTLAELVVEDFRVAILPSADHWWAFSTTEELGKALAEAGHLIVGYGLPWLAGELVPPSD
jgi:hypothetical protein